MGCFGQSIGEVEESTGIGSLLRSGETLQSSIGTDIVLYDEAKTENGRMLIRFLDDEELALTENTYAFIDEAYYDPDPSLSRMSIQMVRGTARFASGQGAKIRKANINVQTPTAQITIRGTNFTTTIDELGRSLIVLLPDEDGVTPSGEIDVTNEGGTVTLTESYAATMVSSLEQAPTPPVTIQNITLNMIDNMFIVNPPFEIRKAIQDQAQNDLDSDRGILDVDFLEFNELESDALADTTEDLEYSELDIDMLGVDFLVDLLDIVEELVRTTEVASDAQQGGSSGQVALIGAEIGFNQDSQYNIFLEDQNIVFYREVNGKIRITLRQDSETKITTFVEGYTGDIKLNGGADSTIVISQFN
jgi:hypothetical protein